MGSISFLEKEALDVSTRVNDKIKISNYKDRDAEYEVQNNLISKD